MTDTKEFYSRSYRCMVYGIIGSCLSALASEIDAEIINKNRIFAPLIIELKEP